MKFYYIANETLDRTSVQAIHVDETCRALSAAGHEVTLYAPWSTGLASSGYRTSFLEVPDTLTAIFFQARLFFRVRKDVRRERPDIIYSRHTLLLFMPALLGRLLRIPLVLEVNGPLIDESRQVDQTLLARLFRRSGVYRFFERYSVRRAARLVVVAPGIREYLVRNYAVDPRRVTVVMNGVDVEAFKPTDRREASGRLGLDQDVVYVGYVGTLNPWQGVRHMVEAAALVDDARFLFVGTGEERAELEVVVDSLGVGGRVQFLPPVPHDRVPEHLAALDICLCYPTRFRANTTSPFKVYEYLACGKAVVIADLAGMREAFGDVVAYAEPEAPAALAEQIGRLVADSAERERLGAAGLAFIRAEHTWARVAERLVGVAESALEARP
jgi:glycosyltransferase involved in cell wall biosynthesis